MGTEMGTAGDPEVRQSQSAENMPITKRLPAACEPCEIA